MKIPENIGVTLLTSMRVFSLFLIIPLVAVILKVAGYQSMLATNLMIVDLFFFAVYLFARGIYLLLWRKSVPPGVPDGLPETGLMLNKDEMSAVLQKSGYRVNLAATYAEKGVVKRISLALLQLSFSLLLIIGTYDNLFHFSGSVFIGIGNPFPLNSFSTYTIVSKGILTSYSDIAYKVQGVEWKLPDRQYPFGAAEIRILDLNDKKIWQGILPIFGEPQQVGEFLFSANSFEYDIWLIMTTTKNHVLYTDWIHFFPSKKSESGYTHHGTLKKDHLNDVDGSGFFDQYNDRLRLDIRYKKEQLLVKLGGDIGPKVVLGNYVFKNEGIGRWAQLRVLRKRHIPLLITFALLSIISAVCYFLSGRKRVWVRESTSGQCYCTADDPAVIESTGRKEL